ncbi:MAG: hypothetical protein H7841_06000 [Magnetospirillum sp. WYHS-4]
MKKVMTATLAIGLLAGCSSMNDIKTEHVVGTAIGVATGGIVGWQFGGGVGQALATTGGALAGGVAGYFAGDAVAKK